MRPLPKIDLQPTFPIDEKELKRRMSIRRWFRPETWAVIAPTGAILALSNIASHPLAALGLVAGAAGILMLTWEHFKKPLEASVMAELVAQSNDQQDQELARHIRRYHEVGQYAYAKALGRFALLKRHIEEKLVTDEDLTMDPEEVEKLVDAICRKVCLKFNAAARLESDLAHALTSKERGALTEVERRRREILEPVNDAYATLWETYENLVTINDLAEQESLLAEIADAASAPDADVDLDQLISELREENDVAKGIHARLKLDKGEREWPELAKSQEAPSRDEAEDSESLQEESPRQRELES